MLTSQIPSQNTSTYQIASKSANGRVFKVVGKVGREGKILKRKIYNLHKLYPITNSHNKFHKNQTMEKCSKSWEKLGDGQYDEKNPRYSQKTPTLRLLKFFSNRNFDTEFEISFIGRWIPTFKTLKT